MYLITVWILTPSFPEAALLTIGVSSSHNFRKLLQVKGKKKSSHENWNFNKTEVPFFYFLEVQEGFRQNLLSKVIAGTWDKQIDQVGNA